MINVFAIAANDASMSYLAMIFGSVNGLINNPSASGGTNVLSFMFKTFNSMVLAVAVLVLVYVTVVGVIATAHEGEFMGKRWNNIWIPLRIVFGIGMLIPTGSGYCGLQILIMWVIIQGIGAADMVWATALNYINVAGNVTAQVGIPSAGVSASLNGLFQGLVCDATARKTSATPIASGQPGSYYCTDPQPTWCGSPAAPSAFNPNQTTLTLGDGGACGQLTYCDQSATGQCQDATSLGCQTCKAQLTALANIVPVLYGIAQQVAAADLSYRVFYATSGITTETNNADWQWIYNYCNNQNIPKNKCCIGTETGTRVPGAACQSGGKEGFPSPDDQNGNLQNPSTAAVTNLYWPYWPGLLPSLGTGANFISTNTSYYVETVSTPLNNYLKAQSANPSNLSQLLSVASNNGWILAGGYYFQIANLNTSNLATATPTLSWSLDITSGGMSTLRNNVNAAAALTNAASSAGASSAGGGSSVNVNMNQLSGIGSAVGDTINGVSSGFLTVLNGTGTNPLIAIQAWGQGMLIAAEVLFGVVLALVLMIGIAGNIDVVVLGSGVLDPVGPWATLVMMFLIPGIYALIGMLISLGGLLAVYTPLIPYIIFSFAAIGWLVSVVEAMVAGPLVALQVLVPSEHQGPLGKAEGALMLLFNVFLRPSLLIFGLIAAMLLAVVVLDLINAGFAIIWTPPINASGGLSSTSPFWSPDPLKFILVVAAYVMLVLAALNKCFSAINTVPAQVMRWIGGGGEAEQAPVGEIKGGVEAAGGKAGGAMVGAAQKGEEKKKSQLGRKKQEADDAKTQLGGKK